jgi:hypothetical protein
MAGQPSNISVAQATRTLLSDLSLLNEKTYPDFIEKYPNLLRENYIVTREAQGAGVYTPNNKFFHWTQKGKSIPMFKATATVTAGANATGTATITSAYHATNGTTSPPGIGHYYMNDTNGELYQVVAKSTSTANAHTVGLKNATLGGSVNITSAHALIYKPTIVGQASGTQQGIYRIDEKIYNECATIKSSQEFTDWNLFEKVDMPGFENSYKFRQQAAEREKFLYDQEQLLMFIDKITGVAGVEDNHRALIPLVKEFGQVDTSSTAINQAFFDNLARLIDAEGYSWEYDALMNINFRLKFEAFLRSTYGAGGGIVWGKAYEEGPMKINDNYSAYSVNDIKFNFTTYKHFSSAAIAGAAVNTGYYNNACLMIPRGFGVQPDGTNVPRFRVRWQGEKETDAPIKIRQTGGLAKPSTDDIEHLVISHVTRKGIDPFGLNGYMWLQPNFS